MASFEEGGIACCHNFCLLAITLNHHDSSISILVSRHFTGEVVRNSYQSPVATRMQVFPSQVRVSLFLRRDYATILDLLLQRREALLTLAPVQLKVFCLDQPRADIS